MPRPPARSFFEPLTHPAAAGARAAGDAALRRRSFTVAAAAYERAVALRPDDAAAHRGLSLARLRTGNIRGALAAAMKATALAPDRAAGWIALGRAFDHAGSHNLAAGAYGRALALRPGRAELGGELLHQRLLCADWRGLDALVADAEAGLEAGTAAVHPFCWQAVCAAPRSLRAAALRHEEGERETPAPPAPLAPATVHPSAHPHGRIRVGYLSGEFHDQATAMLMAGVYEHHDRARFEVVAFDNGIAEDGPMRRRLAGAFDRMVAIRELDADAAAGAVRAAGIDILVNLNGYFGEGRPDVFRRRPARVQVNYLGFPGTVGDGYMDYLVADRVVIPDADFPFYGEKIVRLPGCYQANDDRREVASSTPDRAAHGLPETGFVFACFNNSYKILPAMLDRWAAILAEVDDSVLWLLEDNAAATRNLRREAAARGLDPARLVFSPRVAQAEHLARHRHAGLFLDTAPYGAHTTASDALWSGLPVLTAMGTSFPGRVAASLLAAMDLPELIASSPAEYHERAVALACDPAKLAEVAARLTERRAGPPFDTADFTRRLEAAFAAMYRHAEAGLAPVHFDVPTG